MNRFQVSVLFFFIFVVMVGCQDNNPVSSEDNDSPDISSPDGVVTFNLQGVTQLDLESLTAFSTVDSAFVDTDGNLDIPADEDAPELPIILTNDQDDIILGYFPAALSNDDLMIEDIVYFFVKTYPEISVRGLDDSDLKPMVQESSQYTSFVEMVTDALNQNISVIDIPEFNDAVREFVVEMDQGGPILGDEIITEFKVTYERNGIINFPAEAPIFSSFGVHISHQSGADVFGPKLLRSKGLVLSPSSIINYIMNELFTPSEPTTESTRIDDDGDGVYTITFSNGSGETTLDELVREQNYRNFAATALGYVVTYGIEKAIKKGTCDDVLIDLTTIATAFVSDAYFKKQVPGNEEVMGLIQNLFAASYEFGACINKTEEKFFNKWFKFLEKRLSIAEDVSELIFQLRDFVGSDIRFSETRFFDNNISYDSLRYTSLTDLNINGAPGTEFSYEGLVREKEVAYDVTRGLSSQFIPKYNWKTASDIPFGLDVTGDAEIDGLTSRLSSDEIGVLNLTGKIGSMFSEIRLNPLVTNRGSIPQEIIVQLNPLLKTRIFSLEYDGTTYLTELNLDDFTAKGRVAEISSVGGNTAFNEQANEIIAKRDNSSGFITINLSTGEVQSFDSGDNANYNSAIFSNSTGRFFTIEYDGSNYLTELDPSDFSKIKRIAAIESIGEKVAINEQTNEIIAKRDNNYGFIKINFETGEVQTFDPGDNANYSSAIFSNATGRFFTIEYDGSSYLTELDPNDFSKIKRIATIEEIGGNIAIDEQTNEIIAKRENNYGFIKINFETGEVQTFDPGDNANYDSVILTRE
ncbi:hypothetical protein AB2B38_007710 [Balneola sp. MJW-20]|uniref:hypothetical protein n=1 Tax=Gracilimonas aurantiaca TaxID=3234185 RepID=UPI0034676A80